MFSESLYRSQNWDLMPTNAFALEGGTVPLKFKKRGITMELPSIYSGGVNKAGKLTLFWGFKFICVFKEPIFIVFAHKQKAM